MTTYTLKTTLSEADDIAEGRKTFVFRSSMNSIGYGDEITFRVVKNGTMTRHPLEKQRYCVTYVSGDAPIEKGFVVIGFRRTA